MNTVHFPASGSTSIPKGVRTRSAKTPHPLLWVSGAFAIAISVFAVALIAGNLLPSDLTAVEIEPAVIDPFNQQKLDEASSLATQKQAYLNNLWPRIIRSAFSQ